MYLGPLYINTKEIFLILAVILLALAWKFGWTVAWFDKRSLIILVGLMFGTKTLLPAIHNEAFFSLSILILFLSLYASIFQIAIIYLVGFACLRWLKLI